MSQDRAALEDPVAGGPLPLMNPSPIGTAPGDHPQIDQVQISERRPGRQPSTSHSQIEHVAFELFERDGFEQTTIDDIAAAVGIARRTFFRYFPSKNDLAWGTFDEQLVLFEQSLARTPDDVPMMEAIRVAVLDFNRVDPDEQPWHRRRLALILRTPALQAHSTLRYASWREVVARFAARRLQVQPETLRAQTIGYASLGVAIAAYEAWLVQPSSDLLSLLDLAFADLAAGFSETA
jgi:TetR/AcrR family transcriptional regulator, regulator of mycofactocin system